MTMAPYVALGLAFVLSISATGSARPAQPSASARLRRSHGCSNWTYARMIRLLSVINDPGD